MTIPISEQNANLPITVTYEKSEKKIFVQRGRDVVVFSPIAFNKTGNTLEKLSYKVQKRAHFTLEKENLKNNLEKSLYKDLGQRITKLESLKQKSNIPNEAAEDYFCYYQEKNIKNLSTPSVRNTIPANIQSTHYGKKLKRPKKELAENTILADIQSTRYGDELKRSRGALNQYIPLSTSPEQRVTRQQSSQSVWINKVYADTMLNVETCEQTSLNQVMLSVKQEYDEEKIRCLNNVGGARLVKRGTRLNKKSTSEVSPQEFKKFFSISWALDRIDEKLALKAKKGVNLYSDMCKIIQNIKKDNCDVIAAFVLNSVVKYAEKITGCFFAAIIADQTKDRNHSFVVLSRDGQNLFIVDPYRNPDGDWCWQTTMNNFHPNGNYDVFPVKVGNDKKLLSEACDSNTEKIQAEIKKFPYYKIVGEKKFDILQAQVTQKSCETCNKPCTLHSILELTKKHHRNYARAGQALSNVSEDHPGAHFSEKPRKIHKSSLQKR